MVGNLKLVICLFNMMRTNSSVNGLFGLLLGQVIGEEWSCRHMCTLIDYQFSAAVTGHMAAAHNNTCYYQMVCQLVPVDWPVSDNSCCHQ